MAFADKARKLRSEIEAAILRSNRAHQTDDLLKGDSAGVIIGISKQASGAQHNALQKEEGEENCVTCGFLGEVDRLMTLSSSSGKNATAVSSIISASTVSAISALKSFFSSPSSSLARSRRHPAAADNNDDDDDEKSSHDDAAAVSGHSLVVRVGGGGGGFLSSPRCAQHHRCFWRSCTGQILEALLSGHLAKAIGAMWKDLWSVCVRRFAIHTTTTTSSSSDIKASEQSFVLLVNALANFLAHAARIVNSISFPITEAAATAVSAEGEREYSSPSPSLVGASFLHQFLLAKLAKPVVAFAESVEALSSRHASPNGEIIIIFIFRGLIKIAAAVDQHCGGCTTVHDSVLRLVERCWHYNHSPRGALGTCDRLCSPYLNCGTFLSMQSNMAFWSGYLRNFFADVSSPNNNTNDNNNTNNSSGKAATAVVNMTTTSTVSHALRFLVLELQELLVMSSSSSTLAAQQKQKQEDGVLLLPSSDTSSTATLFVECILTSTLRWYFSWAASTLPETPSASLQRLNDTCFFLLHLRRLKMEASFMPNSKSSTIPFDLLCAQVLAFTVLQCALPLGRVVSVVAGDDVAAAPPLPTEKSAADGRDDGRDDGNDGITIAKPTTTADDAVRFFEKLFDHHSHAPLPLVPLHTFLASEGSIFSAQEQLSSSSSSSSSCRGVTTTTTIAAAAAASTASSVDMPQEGKDTDSLLLFLRRAVTSGILSKSCVVFSDEEQLPKQGSVAASASCVKSFPLGVVGAPLPPSSWLINRAKKRLGDGEELASWLGSNNSSSGGNCEVALGVFAVATRCENNAIIRDGRSDETESLLNKLRREIVM